MSKSAMGNWFLCFDQNMSLLNSSVTKMNAVQILDEYKMILYKLQYVVNKIFTCCFIYEVAIATVQKHLFLTSKQFNDETPEYTWITWSIKSMENLHMIHQGDVRSQHGIFWSCECNHGNHSKSNSRWWDISHGVLYGSGLLTHRICAWNMK